MKRSKIQNDYIIVTGMVTEQIQSIYIVEDTAMILYGMSGVFANNTNNIKGVICNWTSGDDK